jgi:hypothetical protein
VLTFKHLEGPVVEVHKDGARWLQGHIRLTGGEPVFHSDPEHQQRLTVEELRQLSQFMESLPVGSSYMFNPFTGIVSHKVCPRSDYQQRVADEHLELVERTAKLEAFIEDDRRWFDVPAAEQRRMKRQLAYMKLYANVLQERIEAFPYASAEPASHSILKDKEDAKHQPTRKDGLDIS